MPARFGARRMEGYGRRFQGLDLDFDNGRYALNNPYLSSFPLGWSYTGVATNGTATALDLAGNVIQFATGVPRITNRGLLVEEGRTNVMQQSGVPSAWPMTASQNGLTGTVVGTGTEDGVAYQEVRAVGTASGTFFDFGNMGAGFRTAATSGQAWSGAFSAKIISGAASVTDFSVGVVEESAGNVFVGQTVTSLPRVNGVINRASATRTMGATAATCRMARAITFTNGAAVDITIRFYLPQLELGSFPTSPIITTGAAGTRGADNPLLTGLAALQLQCAGGMALLAEVEGEVAGLGFVGIASLNDGALSNRASLLRGAGGALSSRATFNSVAATPGDVAWPAGTGVKRAGLSIVPGRAIACINGTLGTASTPTAVPLFTQLGIGISDPGGGLINLNGYIRRIRIIPRAVSDAELQALTA